MVYTSRITNVRGLPEERTSEPLPVREHPWHLCFCAATSTSEREAGKGFFACFPLAFICSLGECGRVAHGAETSFSLTSICSLGALYGTESDSSTDHLCRLPPDLYSPPPRRHACSRHAPRENNDVIPHVGELCRIVRQHQEVARPRKSSNPSSYQQVSGRYGTTHARGDSGSPGLDGCRLAQDREALG